MKKAAVSFLVGLLALGFLQACRNEEKDLSKLLAEKDLKKAYEFKARFPESDFNIDSLIDALEFSKAIETSDIQEINGFLSEFPYSAYRDSAQSLLFRLEWEAIQKRKDESRVREYISKYPHSPYYKEAEEWLFTNTLQGTIIDQRDQKRYTWRKVYDQIWMTQNLNYVTDESFTSPPVRGYVDSKAGRAYRTHLLWHVCPEGWEVPTVEDYFSMAFSLGANVHFLSNNLFWNVRDMYYPDFDPYFAFGRCIDDRNRWNVFAPALGGTSYWTRTLTTLPARKPGEYNTTNTYFSWERNSGSGPGSKLLGRLEMTSARDARLAVPLRCIKRQKPGGRLFEPIATDVIEFNGVELNLSELPAAGLYRRLARDQNEATHDLIIIYVGKKMFLFYGDARRNTTNAFTPLIVRHSGEPGSFNLEHYRRRDTYDGGDGTLRIEKDKMTIEFREHGKIVQGQYQKTPSEKVFWHEL
jgi:uncharacterized protein (TIGR02145 family)